jgi:hypothetical protein
MPCDGVAVALCAIGCLDIAAQRSQKNLSVAPG